MNPFQFLQSELEKISDLKTERSFYPILVNFLKQVATEDLELQNEVMVIAEASSTVHENKVGFPDLTVQIKSYDYQTVGWIEVKLPEDHLSDSKFQTQFDRYTDSLENVIFTNLREWQLYQWDEKGKAKKVDECLFDAIRPDSDPTNLTKLLKKFFDGKTLEIRTPKQLALALARKTRLLSRQIEDELEATTEGQQSDFSELQNAFSRTLIQDIKPHQFANMAAETIAYSFFLAALEHTKKGSAEALTFRTAIDYLPKSVPVLTDLYELVGRVTSKNETVDFIVKAIIEQFSKANMEKIYHALTHHKEDQDPTIYFYENFLAEYDPKVREERGVYYTPKYVVNYIVKSIDEILMKKLGKIAGIDDPDVRLLDPATGTGTFLMSAIELIDEKKRKQFASLGDQIVQREFVRVAKNHILKHFFGFELMVAPYAIAHLKLTLLLEGLGFNFEDTINDGDSENDRLKIYLANTLEAPEVIHKGQTDIFGSYKSISDESEKASRVKAEEPILVIMGNPPYSGISSNNNSWIDDLLKKSTQRKDGSWNKGYYQVDDHPLGEKKLWLQDDYVKFIRFAQWKIDQMDEGVVGFITNHGFLDNPTFRGMRQSLMSSFNEIYILNLHGNSLKKEKSPDGSKDENVFAIQTGVSIALMVKTKQKKDPEVHYADLWGAEKSKEEFLKSNTHASTKWQKLSPKSPYYFFVEKDTEFDDEYESFTKITDIFEANVTGIVTARDGLVIDFDKQTLQKRMETFCAPNSTDDEIRQKFFGNKKNGKYLAGDSRSWELSEARKLIANEDHQGNIQKIDYRPFDTRSIYYHPKMVDWGREKVMQHMLKGQNLSLIVMRKGLPQKDYSWVYVGQNLIGHGIFYVGNQSSEYVLPLYKFEGEGNERKTNLNQGFIKSLSSEVDVPDDAKATFAYIYGTLYLPSYRKKYADQLRTDFPRIPLPTQVKEAGLLPETFKDLSPVQIFKELSNFGKELQELHLLTHVIFEDKSKWGVKVDGQKPEKATDWQVTLVKYNPSEGRVYVNDGQYFEGIEPEVWTYHIGGYQVLDKWLKDRKKAERVLSTDDLLHYMKIVVSLRETIRLTKQFE